jgi:hypothetical protein
MEFFITPFQLDSINRISLIDYCLIESPIASHIAHSIALLSALEEKLHHIADPIVYLHPERLNDLVGVPRQTASHREPCERVRHKRELGGTTLAMARPKTDITFYFLLFHFNPLDNRS